MKTLNESLKKLGFTEKETEFLAHQFKMSNEQCGANSVSDLKDDNYSWASPKDFKETFTEKQIAGIISSLDSKGAILIEEDGLFYIDYDLLDQLIEIDENISIKG